MINSIQVLIQNIWFQLGWFAAPIFSSTGNYPAIMIEEIANNSLSEGRSSSRLPTFSKTWIDMIRGSADFLGLNYYTSRMVEKMDEPKGPSPSYLRDRKLIETTKPNWKHAVTDYLYSVPQGIGDILRYLEITCPRLVKYNLKHE